MSSGICVISTRRACHVPTTAPTSSTTPMSAAVADAGRSLASRDSAIVAARARTMPIMPSVLPRRALS